MNAQRTVQIIRPSSELSTEDQKIKAAAYCRVSTDSDDQENSFLAQVKYYSDYIGSREDMILVDIYADEGITGTAMSKREEFKRLLNDAKLGRIDRVFCKSVSRFARNSLECIESIRALKDCGTTVVFENDNIDTKTMNSEMVLYVKSAFAQSEALAGSARVSSAYRMKMENGTFTTYCAPFGYRLVNGNLEIMPEEAEIVRKIFNMYLSGLGINSISAKLNREAIEGNGRQWNNTAIRYILTNEKYIGDSLTQKHYTPPMLPLRCIRNKGERDKFYISNTHEAIISRNDFEAVQKLLSDRNIKTIQTRKRYLFSHMIICSHCGWSYRSKAKVCHDSIGVEENKLQTAICKCLSSMMDCKEDVIALIHSNLQYALTGNNSILDTVAIEKQIDNYYDQMGTLVERSASTSGDTDLYDREIKKLCDKIEALRETLKTEQSKSVMTEDVKASIDRILGYLSKTDERSFLTYDDVTIRRLVECIVVHPEGKISVTLKGGFRGEETI